MYLVGNIPSVLATDVSNNRGVEPSNCSIFLAFRTRSVRCWGVNLFVVSGEAGNTTFVAMVSVEY